MFASSSVMMPGTLSTTDGTPDVRNHADANASAVADDAQGVEALLDGAAAQQGAHGPADGDVDEVALGHGMPPPAS